MLSLAFGALSRSGRLRRVPTVLRGRGFTTSSNSSSSSSATVIDGKAVAADVRAEVKARVERVLEESNGTVRPGLAVVLVGNRKDSASYVRAKKKAAAAAGFSSIDCHLPEDASQAELMAKIEELNDDPCVDGLLVQLPLPDGLDARAALLAIDPAKDVDGFHPRNMGQLAREGEEVRQLASAEAAKAHLQSSLVGSGERENWPASSSSSSSSSSPRDGWQALMDAAGHLPCTPLGVMELLRRVQNEQRGGGSDGAAPLDLAGKHVVVVGRSNIVGLPSALMALHADATVSICHSRTSPAALRQLCRSADVLVVGVGKPEFIQGEWIPEGGVVIDVGVNYVDDDTRKSGYRVCGDVDYEAALSRARAITPVPGGVGPMTIAMLLRNVVNNAERRWELTK